MLRGRLVLHLWRALLLPVQDNNHNYVFHVRFGREKGGCAFSAAGDIRPYTREFAGDFGQELLNSSGNNSVSAGRLDYVLRADGDARPRNGLFSWIQPLVFDVCTVAA